MVNKKITKEAICIKTYYWMYAKDILFTEGKKYFYDKDELIENENDELKFNVSGCDNRHFPGTNIVAVNFNYQKFKEYFIDYKIYLRKEKLKKLANDRT